MESIFHILRENCRLLIAAINSRRGIVRFLFANRLLLVIKPWLILFSWYITAYATMHTPLILASLKSCMSMFVMVSLILIDLGISFWCSDYWPISPTYFLFLEQSRCPTVFSNHRLRNSILPINNTGDINPNGSYIEAKVFSIFLLVKPWLSVGISTLNVSLCLSQLKPSILVSFAFVPRCSFAKFNSFSELRLFISKFGSLECHFWSLNPPFSNSSM